MLKKIFLTLLIACIGAFVGVGLIFIPALTDFINLMKQDGSVGAAAVAWPLVRMLLSGAGAFVGAILPLIIGGRSVWRQLKRDAEAQETERIAGVKRIQEEERRKAQEAAP